MIKKVYKYRSGIQHLLERDMDMYRANQFYASTLAEQNDLFEGSYQDHISPVLDQLTAMLNVSTDEVRSSLKNVTAFSERVGIFCLSRSATHHAMWAHYGGNHSGYCIEYDLRKLQDPTKGNSYSQTLDVVYSDDLRKLQITDIRQPSFIQKIFGTKETLFDKEDEVRLLFDSAGKKTHHPSAITGIYFGARASDELIDRFKHLFAGRDIALYQIRENRQLIQLNAQLWTQLNRSLMHDISRFEYAILAHRDNGAIETYDVFFQGEHTQEELRAFVRGFREKYDYKPNNINIFRSRDIQPLLSGERLNGTDYIRYADAFVAFSDCHSDDVYTDNIYKDDKYRSILNKV